MAILVPGKFIYLAHPHTGSSAMTIAVAAAIPEAYDLRPHHMTLDEVREGKYTSIKQRRSDVWDNREHRRKRFKRVVNPEDVTSLITGDEVVFSVVRNPYDYLTTCFVRQAKGQNFEAFVESFNRTPFIQEGLLWYHAKDSHHVLKWENMQEELDTLMDQLGCPRVDMGRQYNTTPDKKPWREYYSPKALVTVHRRFGEEIRHWYSLEPGSETT